MKRQTTRLPSDVKSRLNALAELTGTSMSSIVREALARKITDLEPQVAGK